MSLPALASSLASTLGAPGQTGLAPSYGLECRFTVELDTLKTGWQGCSGLSYSFDEGRGGKGSERLPLKPAYGKVTLTRAVDREASKALQTWLAKMATKHLQGNDAALDTATITLHDAYGAIVADWVLENVRPVKWSGPTMRADSKKVAIETLVLSHRGFLKSESVSTPLTLKGPSGEVVVFPYQPSEVLKTKQAPTRSSTKTVANRPVAARGQRSNPVADDDNVTTYVLRGLKLDESGQESGPTAMQPPRPHVPEALELLTTWATLEESGTGTPSDTRPPLMLNWGATFRNQEVFLVSLHTKWTRFDAEGVTTVADVDLIVEDRSVKPRGRGATNPTSGGIPGRSSHLMLAAESLPVMAERTYGEPGRWREIAAANRVEDPLRVRPGIPILLPAESELATAGTSGTREGR